MPTAESSPQFLGCPCRLLPAPLTAHSDNPGSEDGVGSLVCLHPQVIFLAPLPRVPSSLDDFRYVSGAGTLGPVVRPKVKERCKGPSHGRDGEHWVRLGGPELGGVCWENRARQEGNVDSQCGPRCPAMVTTRLLMKTLTIPRALRAILEQSQLHTRQKGTRLLTDPRSLSPHLQPLQGGGLCGAQTFGVPSTPSRRKYLLSVQTHLNERLRRKIQNLAVVLSLSLLLWNLLLWTRSSWKGHAMDYGRASTQHFSEHLLCQAVGTQTPGDRQGSASSLCPLFLSARQAHFHFIHFIQRWVWKQLLLHSGTR